MNQNHQNARNWQEPSSARAYEQNMDMGYGMMHGLGRQLDGQQPGHVHPMPGRSSCMGSTSCPIGLQTLSHAGACGLNGYGRARGGPGSDGRSGGYADSCLDAGVCPTRQPRQEMPRPETPCPEGPRPEKPGQGGTNCGCSCGCRPPVHDACDGHSLMESIRALDFALYEVTLYLDAYPTNCQALELYHRLLEQRDTAVKEYEAKVGPLTFLGNTSKTQWDWINEPFPWDIRANQ